MPLNDLIERQRAGKELGRIRLGQQVPTKNGKMRPDKLATFRFTTNSDATARAVAELLGGTARPWEGGTQRYEVITTSDELAIMVPPGEAVISQWYELWTGGGCVRRCDGIKATLRGVEQVNGEDQAFERTGQDCVCPAGKERAELAARGRACKPTTRLNVILPDLPDMGVWRVESHGFHAAVELGGDAALLGKARDAGVILPAVLRLEHRVKNVPGKPRQEWYVPRLEIRATLRELAAGSPDSAISRALPPVPAKALTSGRPDPQRPAQPALAAPSGPPQNPQECADRARTAASVDDVQALWDMADRAGGLDDMIADADGILEPLRDVLMGRMDALERAAKASAS